MKKWILSREILKRSFRIVALISLVYVLVTGLAIYLQYTQNQKNSLLEFPEMVELKEMIKTSPGDQLLKERIRNLDLAARRSWFNGLAQITSGAYLLSGGIIILLLSLAGLRLIEGPAKPRLDKINNYETAPKTEIITLTVFAALLTLAILTVIMMPEKKEKAVEFAEPAKLAETAISKDDLANNYPQFRGANSNGIMLNASPFTDWDVETGKGILWKSSVPLPGFSSPIIWQDKLFITGGSKETRSLLAYHADTGEKLWQLNAVKIPGSPLKLPEVSSDTGFAASTPATNGEFVCAIFATGDLICSDLNGMLKWKKNLRVPDNHYGHSSSLLLVHNKLIIQFDDNNSQILYCLDLRNGNVIWQQQRETAISWSSPIYVEKDNIKAIILADSLNVLSYDLETGKQLWNTECLGGEVGPSPVFYDNRIYMANEGATAFALNFLTGDIVWNNDESYLPSVASPMVTDNMVFLFSYSVSCLDSENGQLLWEKDMPENFYSSPLLLDKKIIIFDMQGTMFVIKPDRNELIIEKQIPLKESVVATPAVKGKRMWVRGTKHLYALGTKN